ncbi:MAG: tRNA lysidine(34) synthetase TilS [Pseudoalteromonas sp.]
MQVTALYPQFSIQIDSLMNQGHANFTVALSGGVDSVVLLHLMTQYKAVHGNIGLDAIYVNHGLSEYADDWQQFCKQLCSSLTVPFQAVKVTIENKPRNSLEALARDVRYQALDEKSPKDSVILLGQHLNDQLETFMLRLKRGSGLQGLAAMRQNRKLNSGRICARPLLSITRQEIESFAQVQGIYHITDDSNFDECFDRNFIRQQIIPLLAERFTGFEKSTARSIGLLQQQQDVLDEYTQIDLSRCQNNQEGLNCQLLNDFSAPRQANVLRAWLSQFMAHLPSQKQTEQILSQALTARVDAQLLIQLSSGQVRRHQGYLYFVTECVDIKNQELTCGVTALSDGSKLVLKQGEGIRKPFTDEQVSVRFNCLQARIKPISKPGNNTLKHWFKDAKVAPWLRAHVPLIFYNDELVQVGDYFISSKHADKNGVFWERKV